MAAATSCETAWPIATRSRAPARRRPLRPGRRRERPPRRPQRGSCCAGRGSRAVVRTCGGCADWTLRSA